MNLKKVFDLNCSYADVFMSTFFWFSGGVGFDINCGVRLLRTNLDEKDVQPVKEELTQSLFDHIPVGVGSKGIIPMNARDLVTFYILNDRTIFENV